MRVVNIHQAKTQLSRLLEQAAGGEDIAMKLLLNTHAFLWWMAGDSSLSSGAADAIADGANSVWVSAASVWEMAIKKALGKLIMPDDLETALETCGFRALPITVGHALRAGALPRHHDDPFDRMLIAQAQLEGLTIVTRDDRFLAYGIPLIAA